MVVNLLLIILFCLILIGVSMGGVFFSLIKRRKKLLIASSLTWVVVLIGSFYVIISYSMEIIDYIGSEKFQDDTKKGSVIVGETMGSVSTGLSKGLSLRLEEDEISKLAQKSGLILGKSIRSIASSLDSTVGNTLVYVEKTLEEGGLEFGRAVEIYNRENNQLGVFIDCKKDFSGRIRITNYDQTGRKIDVAEKQITMKAGEGSFEKFTFPGSGFGITTYFILSQVE